MMLMIVLTLHLNFCSCEQKQDCVDEVAGRKPLTGRTFNGGMEHTANFLDLVKLVLNRRHKGR